MNVHAAAHAPASATTEHFDVLIVGAGISGIGAGWHMVHQLPGKSFVILENQDGFGGTWRTHKYPGIRSDSDLYTFGYRFKPWVGKPIATAEEINRYLAEVISESHLDDHIRYGHKILAADWSEADALWRVRARLNATGEEKDFTCNFLWMCQGYYRHDKGYTPQWPGMADYTGRIVHPQHWPDDLNVTDKRVIVIGSGATAATLVPNIADKTAHTYLLQRSPTYFIPARNANAIADMLREIQIDETWIHEIVRRRILFDQKNFTRRCFSEPEAVKAELLGAARAFLGPDYDIGKHFTPNYLPWRQRIAYIPDGDLFKGVASGKAEVVTDEIERFTATGVLLKSGRALEADVIVTATGFDLSVTGDIAFSLDGAPLNFADTVTYRGMMFTGAPNLVWIFGYFRASWTLRVDMVADFVARLLTHMDARGARSVRPQLRATDRDMKILPWVDEEDFNPGYLMRGGHLLPKRGDKPEWMHNQDYWREKDEFPLIDLDDNAFVYR
jgi:cation diffusion facilitator CzcD-associated flavoprotein CzcO